MTSYNDMVSTELQDELISIRDSMTKDSFRIGDIVEQVANENPDTSMLEIYAAVGLFSGKRERTVREYFAVSAFYPEEVRQEFAVLSFDHFRVAMRLGGKWHEALDWACGQATEFNRPATVDAMEIQFANHETIENYEPLVAKEGADKWKAVLKKMRDLLTDKEANFSRELVQDAFRVIERIEMALAIEKETVL